MENLGGELFAVALPVAIACGFYWFYKRMRRDISVGQTGTSSHKVIKFVAFAAMFAVVGFVVMMIAVGAMSGMANS